MRKARIAVLISGGGTNLQALIDAQNNGTISHGEIVAVISNQEDAYGLERAKKAGISGFVVKKEKILRDQCGHIIPEDREKKQAEFEQGIENILAQTKADLIVLAGFLAILSANFTKKYPERILNIHPSLIPSFCGKGFYGLHVHEAALEKGVKVTGATVHFVNEIPDGGKILIQKAVEVQEGDTPQILQRRVMEQAEWKILPQAVEMVSEQIVKKEYEKESEMGSIYDVAEIGGLLSKNIYPGRGIVIGKSRDGSKAVAAYFIMGRSDNSRNRVFLEDGEDVVIHPADASKVEDPSLIIYKPIRKIGNKLIVTNGDQTDTIYDFIKEGKSFEEALRTREFEPDGPNWTPRISGMFTFAENDFTYQMSILKSMDAQGSACARYTYEYKPIHGLGHFIHTYVCDGNPIPTFQGEPERVEILDDIDEMTNRIWETLNADNKIALYVRYIDLKNHTVENRMINRYVEVK